MRAFGRARLVVAGIALALAAVAATAHASRVSSDRVACGVERWTAKTLQDRPLLLPAQVTTIAYLVSRPAPSTLPDVRLPFERHVFTVTGRVTLIRHEDDDDFHVVLSDGTRTMITESPAPACTSRAFPVRRAQMAAARRALRACSRARVTGVAFFDFEHGQTGVAPNAIELHPVLAFRCLSGAAPTPGPATTPKAAAGAGGSAGKKCEPGYSPCLPIVADLNCGDIPDSLKPIRVTGSDPYRLDGDGDGYGCESG